MFKIKYYDIDKFIKDHIRFGQHWNKKIISMSDTKWQTLEHDSYIGGYEYAKGSQFKVFETSNFGWIVFHSSTTKSPNGSIPGRMIHKW